MLFLEKLFFLVILCLLTSGCMTIRDSNFIHPMTSDYVIETVPRSYTMTKHILTRNDNTTSYGLSFVKENSVSSIIYYGGNEFTANSGRTEALLKVFESLPVDLYIFDRRGYGKNSGNPDAKNILEDAIQTYDYVKSLTNLPVIVYGQSLGSFESANVAANRQVDGLILESSATTVQEWLDTVELPLLFSFVFLNVDDDLKNIDNVSAVKKYTGPTLILVGENDKNAPPELSRKLFKHSTSHSKEIEIIEDASHNDVPFRKRFISIVSRFISKIEKCQSKLCGPHRHDDST